MVFRRDNKSDSFQRQMSAIRQQIGADDELDDASPPREARYPSDRAPQLPDEGATNAFGFGDTGSSLSPSVTGSADMSPVDPPMPVIPSADAQTTVIAHDTTWKGELQSQGTVHVHGRFDGSIIACQDVYVADDAEVNATINATNVVIAGNAKGTIRCDARFEVLPAGRVSGDIQAPTLVVHEGATVSGQLRMGPPEAAETKPTSVLQRRATRGTA